MSSSPLRPRSSASDATPQEPQVPPAEIVDRQRSTAERDQAEAALRDSELQFKALFDSIDEGCCVIEKVETAPGEQIDFRYVLVNPAFARQAGSGVVVGKTIREAFPGEGEAWFETYDHVVTTGEPIRFERDLVTHGRVLELYAFRLDDHSRRRVGVLFKDITDRKRAEEHEHRAAAEAIAAAEANMKFRTFFEQGSYFAGVMARDGTLVEANRLSLEFCGFARADVIGRKFWDTGWWNRSEALMDIVRQGTREAAAGGVFRREMPYFLADGTERILDLTLAPVKDAAGRVLFIAPTGTDITERKQAEQALTEAARRKDEFLAMLAHELRNPLAPIRNAMEVLQQQGGDTVTTQSVAMVQRQVAQITRLIDDLLDVSRISRGKIELRTRPIDLALVVRQAVEDARPLADSLHHELTVSLPDTPVLVDADAARLAQVVGNLLNNACKFTEQGGRISLALTQDGDRAVLRVRDTGIGIAADQLPRIFDMFAQVDTSLERSQGGLGIGLTLLKILVEMHGGTVEATSKGIGHGTEFVIRLPVLAGARPLAPEPAVRELTLRHHRILVVDDNIDSAESMATLLNLKGHETQVAHDGREAIDAAESFRPDVVLLDIGLPHLNGYEAARRIRERPWGKDISLVALTGWGQREDREQSRDAGIDGHLVKPVAFETLTKLLNDLDAR